MSLTQKPNFADLIAKREEGQSLRSRNPNAGKDLDCVSIDQEESKGPMILPKHTFDTFAYNSIS